jgi:glycosyltransferase involved in cell wall biosynthesis
VAESAAAWPNARIDLVLGTSLGGVGRHVRSLSAALQQAGARTSVHGPRQTEETFGFAETGADFHEVPVPAGFAPVAAARAAHLLRRQFDGAELVHAHGFRAGLVTARAVRAGRGRDRPPLVVTWHNIPAGPRLGSCVRRRLERSLARASDVSLAVSSDLVDRIVAAGGRDVRLLPVGSDRLPAPEASVHETRAELRAGDRPLVFTAGRLHRQKGIDVLIAAAAQWQARLPQPLLVIAGDGPEQQPLADLAVRSGVDVRWLGYVGDRSRLASLLAAADVVVVPSRWEGSPLSVHEALMAGRPLVTSSVGGLPSLVRPDEASFVPAEDAGSLAAAVCALLDDREAAGALGRAGQRAAGRWPDADATTARLLQIYAEQLHR